MMTSANNLWCSHPFFSDVGDCLVWWFHAPNQWSAITEGFDSILLWKANWNKSIVGYFIKVSWLQKYFRVPCIWVGAKPIYLNGDYEYAARSKCRNWQTRDPMATGLAARTPMNVNATGFLDQSNLYEESCAKQCNLLCIQISPN